MKFGSLFSGIGGFDLGFEQAGMECAWQCEIDNTARSVLAKHWPGVPCIEDVRNVTRNNVPAVDLVCGGFPCQDLSVAGKRAGLAGDRSGLWFEFHRVVEELRPKWVVVENVPGLLSSNRGADFAIILRGLVECWYGVTWRVLDAQYFGVAQRRRRVFIVGSLGDGRSAQVLFEREGLFGHPPARRASGQEIAATVGAQPPSRRNGGSAPTPGNMIVGTLAGGAHPSGFNSRDAHRGNLVVEPQTLAVAHSLSAHHGRLDLDNQTYVTIPDVAYALADATGSRTGTGRDAQDTFIFEPRYARNGRGAPDTIAPPLKAQNGGTGKGDGAPVVGAYSIKTAQTGNNGWGVNEEVMNTLDGANGFAVAFTQNSRDEVRQIAGDGQIAGALAAETGMHQTNYVAFQSSQSGVRRLTPTECERLQGFPDGHTAGQSDSARYRQLGNAVAVPVARWIGTRIMEVLP